MREITGCTHALFFVLSIAYPVSLTAQPRTGSIPEVRVSSRIYVPKAPVALRAETSLVEIGVTVRDRHGLAVPGLGKTNFQILDQGNPREIAAFSVEAMDGIAPGTSTDQGRSAVTMDGASTANTRPVKPQRFLALYFDDINTRDSSFVGNLKQAQAAAALFVNDGLGPGVLMGIFTASGTQSLDFTADSAKLIETIKSLKPHPRTFGRNRVDCPEITPHRAYRISNDHDPDTLRMVMLEAGLRSCWIGTEGVRLRADEILRQSTQISADILQSLGRIVDHLAKQTGNRVLLVASSGFIGRTVKDEEDRIITQALRAGVVINALDSKGLFVEPVPGSRPFDQGIDPSKVRNFDKWEQTEVVAVGDRVQLMNEPLADLAAGTGGTFLHDNNDLHGEFQQLGAPSKVTYRLAFRPENAAGDATFHALKVKLTGAEPYKVQARPGYFSRVADAQAAETLDARLDREVMAADAQAGFPLGIAVRATKSATGGTELSVIAEVDISKLKFQTQGDRRVQKIHFVSALFDSQGNIVTGKEGTMELALSQENYTALARTGLRATVTLPATPGIYSLREVAAETVDGKIACSTHRIEIR